ncbi:MAG: ATP-binding protein [Christensenellaceae bacterium]|jgi:predicted AAA+ superfamily ATPase|nr:ATP-binding protein [Christensenellaceae bacterium]
MDPAIIPRNNYLESLIRLKDLQIIKVVTGIRRSGKSTLFETYRDYLFSLGIETNQIIFLNLELLEFSSLCTCHALYEHIIGRLVPDKMNYVFIDEVQMCAEFQRAINSLFVMKNVDVYVTGSNSYFFSGKLSTLLSGRYITIEMLPLSFSEYFAYSKESDDQKSFREYMQFGGFPFTLQCKKDDLVIRQYLEGVYNTIIRKDIIEMNKVHDLMVLDSVVKFIFDNVGNITTPKKISDTLTSNGRKISQPTVEKFLQFLCNSFIVYQANRYDVKGKQYLKSLSKYYLADMGFRNFLLGSRNPDTGHVIENIVYLELRRRGYQIYIGKVDNMEIDFVAVDQRKTIYIQVAETVRDPIVLERKLAPLRAAKDYHRRILLTNDYDLNPTYNGIESLNVVDFLLGNHV